MIEYEIPLSPSPKRFLITLNGTAYQLLFMYRDAPMGGWVMDINDSFGQPMACGLPLRQACPSELKNCHAKEHRLSCQSFTHQ